MTRRSGLIALVRNAGCWLDKWLWKDKCIHCKVNWPTDCFCYLNFYKVHEEARPKNLDTYTKKKDRKRNKNMYTQHKIYLDLFRTLISTVLWYQQQWKKEMHMIWSALTIQALWTKLWYTLDLVSFLSN